MKCFREGGLGGRSPPRNLRYPSFVVRRRRRRRRRRRHPPEIGRYGFGRKKPPSQNEYFKFDSKNWKHKDVKLEIGDGIAYLTLNAPERKNSLNFDVQDSTGTISGVRFGVGYGRYVNVRRTDWEGLRPPWTPPIASAFGDTDGEFFA